jgi:hypothetical protein
MKVLGAGNGGRQNRGFDVIGKIVSVGEAVGEEKALKLEVMRGAMKGKEILMTLDAEVSGKNKNANKIGPKGLVASNKTIYGVGGVVHVQAANYTSEKDDEVTTMKGRWAYMAGGLDDNAAVTVEPASLLVLPNDERKDVRLLWPDKGAVVRDGKEALAAKVLEVAQENSEEQQVYLFNMDGKDLNVGLVSLMKREGEEYVTRTEEELKEQITQRIANIPEDAEVAVVPGSRANLSKQAGIRMVDGKAQEVDLIPGISAKDILLTNGKWVDDVTGDEGPITNRVENATLRAAGGDVHPAATGCLGAISRGDGHTTHSMSRCLRLHGDAATGAEVTAASHEVH